MANFFGGPAKRSTLDDADDLQLSMRTTANCRHNASVRLQKQGKLAFNATAILSLALVFIPLMQNSGVDLSLKDAVLNMMQVFLGVAVLVYSLIIGTARYDTRALQFSQCADKIKDLIRDLKNERTINGGSVSIATLIDIQRRYSEVLTSSENHEGIDYLHAMFYMSRDYTIPSGSAAIMHLQSAGSTLRKYAAPGILFIVIMLFTSEMFGLSTATQRFLPSWHKTANSGPINRCVT